MMLVNYSCEDKQKYVIQKFNLDARLTINDIEMPDCAQIVSLDVRYRGTQSKELVIWAITNIERKDKTRTRRFLVVLTGGEITVEPGGIMHFIGTAPNPNGIPMYHVFEVFSPLPDDDKGDCLTMPHEWRQYIIPMH